MAAGDIRVGNVIASGEVAGTGAAIDIQCGFKPSLVLLVNRTQELHSEWSEAMGDAAAMIFSGTASGTNAAENAHTHAVALDSGASGATNSGASKLQLGTPSFSGTGFATAGQAVTTTDNQTMPAVDTAAGMWFYCPADAASTPVLILSNTIVAGAPAVLTCQGVPAATNAGAYKIVSDLPVGTHTHAAGSLADAASGAGSSHNHVFTGAAAASVFVTSAGITPNGNGFSIGTNALINTAADKIYWIAFKD